MSYDFDVVKLIALVHDHPVLWDRTLDYYQNRRLSKRSWRTISSNLIDNFNELLPDEQEIIVKRIIKKWGNIRDHWMKCEKGRSKEGHVRTRYIYERQLSYLKKSLLDSQMEDCQSQSQCTSTNNSIKTNPDQDIEDIEKRLLIALEKRIDQKINNNHLLFFQGILPSIEDFNKNQIMLFQRGVLDLIIQINELSDNKN